MMGKSNTGVCRGQDCGAEFLWAVNDDSGAGVPLNPDPDRRGRYVEVGTADDGRMLVRRLGRDEDPPAGADRYMAHGVTCVNASAFKRERK